MFAVKILSILFLLLLFFVIYRSARREKTHPQMRAAQKFITSFIDAVQDLSQGKGDAYEMLKDAFPKHQKAYLEFRSRLKGRSRKHFDEAWKEYSCSGNGHPLSFLEQYFAGGNETAAREKRQLAALRIKRLIGYAQNGYSPL